MPIRTYGKEGATLEIFESPIRDASQYPTGTIICSYKVQKTYNFKVNIEVHYTGYFEVVFYEFSPKTNEYVFLDQYWEIEEDITKMTDKQLSDYMYEQY